MCIAKTYLNLADPVNSTLTEVASVADRSLSGLTSDQAEALHEQFKIGYSAFVGIAALVHLLLFAANPWF